MLQRRTPLKRARMTVAGPTARRRAQKRRASEKAKRDVYALVDAREGGVCRVLGLPYDLEHHHITPRSLGGKHTTANVVLLTRRIHQLVTDKKLTITGDADKVLTVIWKTKDGDVETRH